MAFVDGFNLYHALDWYEFGRDEAECRRYQKYKWLNLKQLAQCYVSPKSEELVGVRYFTTYPHWRPDKERRHRRYVLALGTEGIKPTFGEFKAKQIECRAKCKLRFTHWEEKQTDVNIAVAIVDMAHQDAYDKALLITGDSDQVPAIRLVRKMFPGKTVAVVVPIGRKGKELEQAAHQKFTMTEEHLLRSQFPDRVFIPSQKVYVQKPYHYR